MLIFMADKIINAKEFCNLNTNYSKNSPTSTPYICPTCTTLTGNTYYDNSGSDRAVEVHITGVYAANQLVAQKDVSLKYRYYTKFINDKGATWAADWKIGTSDGTTYIIGQTLSSGTMSSYFNSDKSSLIINSITRYNAKSSGTQYSITLISGSTNKLVYSGPLSPDTPKTFSDFSMAAGGLIKIAAC